MDNAVSFLLVADVGGTNCNLGLYAQPQHKLIYTYQYPSQEIANFTQFISEFAHKITQEYHKPITGMVCAVAGVVGPSRHQVRLTNLPLTIDPPALAHALGVNPERVLMCNDFTAVALGYPFVSPDKIVTVHPVAEHRYAQKAFIGAGTGLGVAALAWDTQAARYMPLASEGGHTDFAPDTHFDLLLTEFIKRERAFSSPVSWEDVLSGSGMSRIYEFLGTQRTYTRTQITVPPDYISRYAQHDAQCYDTFQVYMQYYARFAKNCALTYTATGGLYIAGGIAAKNKELFTNKLFLEYFLASEKQRTLLQKVPVYLIQDYSVSLYGAAEYARSFHS